MGRRKGRETPDEALAKIKELNHLLSVGQAALDDFDLLGIETTAELAKCDAHALYEKLCHLKGKKLDPSFEEVFRAAVAQAQDPNYDPTQTLWREFGPSKKSDPKERST
jgi:hypothetical protein